MEDINLKTKSTTTLGSISGWDNITTRESDENTHIPSNDHDYTINDLYLELRKVLSILDKDKLDYLNKLIMKHMRDKNNPHKLSLDSLGTSVLKELYNLWISTGHTGDEDQFIKQLFQYIEIADLNTTLEGQSLNKVPSVYAVAESLKIHNDSLDAHDNLISKLFPGTPLIAPPTYAVLGLVSQYRIPEDIEVTREGSYWICNNFGHLAEVPSNKVLADWTFGEPALPIFGSFSNISTYSEDFSNSVWEKENITIEKSNTILSPRNVNEYVFYAKESSDTSPVKHAIKRTYTTEKNQIYTFSIFMYPVNRRAALLKVDNKDFIGFDFIDKKIYQAEESRNSLVYSGMSCLTSGWYRIWITFRANESTSIQTILSDIYDGDTTYNGNGLAGCGLFGAQLSKSDTVTPYLPTANSPRSCGETRVKIKISDEWFNTEASTIITEVSTPYSGLVSARPQTVYTVGSDTGSLATSVVYPITTIRHRPYFSTYGENNSRLILEYGNINYNDRAVIGQTFNRSELINISTGGDPLVYQLGSVVNTREATYIYLGSNNSQSNPDIFNGYLFRFAYYPFKCEVDSLSFFLEDTTNE